MNKKFLMGFFALAVLAIAGFASLQQPGVFTTAGNAVMATANENRQIKEFAMQSFVEFEDGKPKPQFSLKEITVNRGDLVRIKITTTIGTHNFNLDEFNVSAETPLNQETVVEFVADKSGDFIYYCSKPGHRQNGHWGTLKVSG